MKLKHQIKTFVAVAVLAISTTIFLSIQTSATDYGKGFFSGQVTASGYDAGFVLRNCVNAGGALDAVVNAPDKKKALIDLMWTYYNGCGRDESASNHGDADFNSRRNRVGARYIIWTMTGQVPDKNIFKDGNGSFVTSKVASSSAPFDYWKTLMNQSNVTVTYTGEYTSTANSGYVKTSNGQYDVYRFNQTSSSKRAIIIKQNSNEYVIRVECANPLGTDLKLIQPPSKDDPDPEPPEDVIKLPEPEKTVSWSLAPRSLVKKCAGDPDAFCLLGTYQTNQLTVISGDQVKWAHRVYNVGPDKTNTNIEMTVKKQTNTGEWKDGVSDTRPFGGLLSRPGVPVGSYVPSLFYPTRLSLLLPTTQTIKSNGDDIGKQFCQKVSADPKSSKSSDSVTSTAVCVKVRQSWFLKAETTISKTKVNKGDTGNVTWTHKVTNQGPSKVSKDKNNQNITIKSSIKRIFYKKDSVYPTTQTLSGGAVNNIKDQAKNTSKSVTSNLAIASISDDITRVCEWLVISPESSESQATLESEEKCVDIEAGWEIEPSASVSPTKAFISDKVTWTHQAKNKGPNKTTEDVKYWFKATDKKTLLKNTAVNGSTSFTSIFDSIDGKVPSDVNPGQYCRGTTAQSKSSSDAGSISSTEACVTVPYNYKLVPTVHIPSNEPTPGSVVTVQPKVKNEKPNSKPATKSENVTWKLNVAVNGGAKTSLATDNKQFGAGDNTLTSTDYTLPAHLGFGDKVCFSLHLSKSSYNGETGASGGAVESDPECVTIGKRPKVQVLGGDVWADGEINTNMNTLASGKFVGSWGEYGAIALGGITGFATGGVLGDQNSVCNYSLLSFTNKKCDNTTPQLGSYTFTPSSLDLNNFFNFTNNNAPNIDLGTLIAGSYKITQNVTLTASASIDKQLVLSAEGYTVTIASDIKYADGAYPISGLPQIVIIAKNIKIDKNVKQVDAWLVADEVINTCSAIEEIIGNTLDADICPEQLTINGPVKTRKIQLHRTGGSNSSTDQWVPAETINFRPDAYLWAFNEMNKGFSIKSTYIIDQPVRF